MKSIARILPGLLTAAAVAAVSVYAERMLPIHLVGASVIALFIGMMLNRLGMPEITQEGFAFAGKKLLKFAIILLGASLNIRTVIQVGRISLVVMVFTLIACFGGGYFVGKALHLNWKLSNMISAGTGICGGSAIAAMAPVIEADDRDVAYAMSATFLFDMAMILLFPVMGRLLGLSDMAYGLWAGTAVNDTSSVVAAGYAYSEAAGDFAAMVKLTRTLTIIPVVIVFALIRVRLKKQESAAEEGGTEKKVRMVTLFPWFITGFVGLSVLNSFGVIPSGISIGAKEVSRFLMVTALAAIGLKTSFGEMRRSGAAPMVHGFIISALVVVVAIGVEYCMGML